MDDTITTIYCLCDDFLKATGHRDDLQVTMSTAEVMTVPLVAAAFFGANVDKTRLFLHEYGYIKKMLGKSRLNRRIHAIKAGLWRRLFALLAELFKRRNTERSYVVDSLPVAVCDDIRIRRCRLLSSRRKRRSVPRLHREQAALLLRFADSSGGERGRRAGGVRSGGGFGGRR